MPKSPKKPSLKTVTTSANKLVRDVEFEVTPDAISKTIEPWTKSLNAISNEIESLDKKAKDKSAEFVDLNKTFKKTKKEFDKITESIQKLQENITGYKEKKQKIEEKIKILSDGKNLNITEVQSSVTLANVAIEKLEGKCKELQTAQSQCANKADALEKILNSNGLPATLADYAERLTRLNKKFEVLCKQTAELPKNDSEEEAKKLNTPLVMMFEQETKTKALVTQISTNVLNAYPKLKMTSTEKKE